MNRREVHWFQSPSKPSCVPPEPLAVVRNFEERGPINVLGPRTPTTCALTGQLIEAPIPPEIKFRYDQAALDKCSRATSNRVACYR